VSEAQQKNAIAILKKIYLYAMCFMHENCIQISRLFNIVFVVASFFAYLPACGLIDTHKKLKKNLVEYSENTKLYIIYGS